MFPAYQIVFDCFLCGTHFQPAQLLAEVWHDGNQIAFVCPTCAAEVANAGNDAGLDHGLVIPLTKPGIVIGSIFVVTIVMGDFVTVGVMGGQQIASVGKIINTQMGALQFPPAAANSVILLVAVLLTIWGLTRLVDIRKEL